MSFEFLIEMAWKSALISGVALALVAVLRSRAAADRAAVLRVAVGLLLLLPLLALYFPRLEIEAWSAEALPAVSPELMATAAAYASSPGALPVAETGMWDDPSLLFLILYLGGVAMAAARLGAGLWTLRRWTNNARDVACPQWMEAFERARWSAGAPERLRLMVSHEAASPLSWGLIRPVILIDPDTLGEPQDADAILAHEIAHVVRRDWAVLMLTRVAAGLFWFNPLVWILEREVVQQAEEAADIEAALCVEPARYAQTLVHWAQFSAGAAVPANSIAPSASALARRVRAILDARLRSTPSGSASALAATLGCAAFAVALALLQLIPAAAEAHPDPEAPAAAPAAPFVPPAPGSAAAPLPPQTPMAIAGAVPRPPVAAGVPTPVALAALAPHPPVPPIPPGTPRAPRARAIGPGHAFALAGHPHIDEAEIERRVEAALRESGRFREIAVANSDRSREIGEHAARAARNGIAAGAVGMERGAEGMEQGARNMEQEARRLRSRDYRERKIAEAARRGERLSHEQLIEMADGLREGSRDMMEGARDMRRAAAEMRREARD
ncbi:M56 family metallopeptidase [Allosphingosinicella sp.]|jgi:beta-lactamase regulating signal transducer with metallopeptidase domain|uniref:M56 family metallopeptidase n=1 Tax=Allosphingosinicella sp. TaxID=2823234 RepID=UPI002EDD84B9